MRTKAGVKPIDSGLWVASSTAPATANWLIQLAGAKALYRGRAMCASWNGWRAPFVGNDGHALRHGTLQRHIRSEAAKGKLLAGYPKL